MIDVGLSAAEFKHLNAALATSKRIDIRVTLLDLDHGFLEDLSPYFLDGSVDIDTTTETTRSASLELLDPKNRLDLANRALSAMIRVHYGILVGDVWRYFPIFTGPITRTTRGTESLSVECQGKEIMAQRTGLKDRMWKKGLSRAGVIESIMSELAGETKFQFSDLDGETTPKHLTLRRTSFPWTYAQAQARALRAVMYYDGRGTLRVKKRPSRPVFIFRAGNGGTLVSAPEATFSELEFNTVWVTGLPPEGSNKDIDGFAYLPRSHPQSPTKLARNGVPSYITEIINSETSTVKGAIAEARDRVEELVDQQFEVTFDAVVIPYIEEHDVLRVVYADVIRHFRLRKLRIPLNASSPMQVGYSKTTTSSKRNLL